MTDCVLYEVSDHIATLTLNRPESRNPISDPDMIEAVLAALADADRDPGVRVLILTGAGSAFSSGGNLKTMTSSDGLKGGSPVQTRRNYRDGIQRLPLAFEALEKPVVAAVNGPAIGAGCDLACMADVRLCSESAIFAESFVKVGLVPGDGGAWLLPRVVGFAKASEMALTGDAVKADEALRIGLVSRVVPDSELIDAARRIAGRIVGNPPAAVRMTRRLLREAHLASLPTLLELSAAMQALAQSTKDHERAVAAMIEKRGATYLDD
jgi:enoyl-CoA hydratase/carnithine racemase